MPRPHIHTEVSCWTVFPCFAERMASDKADPNPFSFKTFMKRGEGPSASASASGSAGQAASKKAKKKSVKVSQESLPFPDVEEIGMHGVWLFQGFFRLARSDLETVRWSVGGVAFIWYYSKL